MYNKYGHSFESNANVRILTCIFTIIMYYTCKMHARQKPQQQKYGKYRISYRVGCTRSFYDKIC